MECSRCGKCCIQFAHQIHFLEHEPFVTALRSPSWQSILDKFSEPGQKARICIYRKVMQSLLHDEGGIIKYHIPIKEEVQIFLSSEEKEVIILTPQNHKECIFLDWNPLPYCMIHDSKPAMCKNYPSNKAWACLNHPERYYTRPFLEFQRSQIGRAVDVLRYFYHEKVHDHVAFEILTLLMDFGKFSIPQLKHFFVSEFAVEPDEFQRIVDQLFKLTLVYIKGDEIEGISVKEVERSVDQIMKERNWNYMQ